MMVKQKYGVLLLSAGYGKRLHPITLNKPKVLVEVNKKPILEYWLDFFNKLKNPPNEICINTHYLSKKINSFLDKKSYSYKIKISFEKKLKGSLGTIINNKKWIKKFDKIIIVYADILFTNNLENLINKFISLKENHNAIILSDIRKNVSECGQLKFNKNNILTNFSEKPKKKISRFVNSGLYLFDTSYLLKQIKGLGNKNDNFYDIAATLMPLLVEKAYVYVIKGKVVDIGTYKGLIESQKIKFTKKSV